MTAASLSDLHTQKKKDLLEEMSKPPQEVRSVMGNIRMEKGGAGLKFEMPLDDVSNIDARWIRRLTLRVLEMLHYEEKHEKLVDLALRFNALSE